MYSCEVHSSLDLTAYTELFSLLNWFEVCWVWIDECHGGSPQKVQKVFKCLLSFLPVHTTLGPDMSSELLVTEPDDPWQKLVLVHWDWGTGQLAESQFVSQWTSPVCWNFWHILWFMPIPSSIQGFLSTIASLIGGSKETSRSKQWFPIEWIIASTLALQF